MSSSTASVLKPLSSMADSTSLLSPPSIFARNPYFSIHPRPRPIKLHLSDSSLSSKGFSFKLKKTTHFSSFTTFVAQTSDWADQEEDKDNTTITLEQEQEENGEEEPNWENQGADETEGNLSDWGEPEGEDTVVEAGERQEESGEEGVFEEEEFVEPPEDAKLFVGNLPYDVDSEKLAMLFEKAGTVEIAEVIYNRETDRSRGFGFVTMSTVEEAEKAVEMFHRYDIDGRLLTVNKAAPRGTQPERAPRVFEPGFRIYVGNLPWEVDNARLEQVFSEHGKVVNARVVYDRETGRSRGFGFVTMSSETELNDAIAALDGQNLDGRAIRVNVAEDRQRRSSF
ncbi:31 kDa ribonucleoprotein [Citrus sinensis]|uniref:RRM domain-containing protein n=2 Tax=Citrus TaxID=2706 RepID=A0A067G141_CITSI|nr:28 kDa ribonucleoprotein, chloroplastic [Citrus x clementina]XP_006476920.2 28 kDa ribonucleoprotein, chloroplastic-like [Citrus sinensis]XP_024043631.1 28 kDa ribonucleoprotein, chloroplastic [Citrus x clementina]GAY47255.1 hypothetical protein CUMW_103200 [Citrus unshiu]ESR53212.1 hypothetical protein CICLE_v10020731mg [Citrus x clementina]KAH9720556.1 31 kDa ribonucleoprotein [Citrus sinensis]KDO69432.1 hypothetical protein CISIN_1g017842mg [Citrus sinensis]